MNPQTTRVVRSVLLLVLTERTDTQLTNSGFPEFVPEGQGPELPGDLRFPVLTLSGELHDLVDRKLDCLYVSPFKTIFASNAQTSFSSREGILQRELTLRFNWFHGNLLSEKHCQAMAASRATFMEHKIPRATQKNSKRTKNATRKNKQMNTLDAKALCLS